VNCAEPGASRPADAVIKVCVVVSEFPKLSETFILDQIVGLTERGFSVSIAADQIRADAGSNPEREPLRSLLGKSRPRWRWARLLHLLTRHTRGAVRSAILVAADLLYDSQFNRFDVLIAHFGYNGSRLARSKLLGRFDRPFMTVFHGLDVGLPLHENALQRNYQKLFSTGELLLPVCDCFRDILIRAGAVPERVRVHRMGIDTKSIPFEPQVRAAGQLNIISVCRLVEKKGMQYALDALSALRERRVDLPWRWEIIGDGPLRSALEEQARSCGIEDRVQFIGPCSHEECKRRLRAAHVFLLPSLTARDGDMEGVPVSIMEAMAAGVVVVSSYHSGIGELVESGVSGLLAPERDGDAVSRHVEWIADNPDGAAAMAKAARAVVERRFNRDTLNDTLAALITSTVAERRGARS
jgi:colanic acid/amylovoran biosynthesis glycosyltransferase